MSMPSAQWHTKKVQHHREFLGDSATVERIGNDDGKIEGFLTLSNNVTENIRGEEVVGDGQVIGSGQVVLCEWLANDENDNHKVVIDKEVSDKEVSEKKLRNKDNII